MSDASANVSASPAAESPAILTRVVGAGEWLLTLGLALTLAWTTLCLGGYLAETMVWSARAVWALAALGALLLVLRPRALDWRVLLPVPFLLFALGSVLWIAPAKWLAWREWLLWFQMWLWFALALHCGRSRAQTWTLAGTVIALAVVGVAMAAYQRFVDPKWIMLGRTQAEQFWTRSAGMFGIPNSLAAVIELVLPLCLVWLGSRSVSVAAKVFCGWVAVLLIFGLVLTGSRGGWIGAATALALWPALSSRTVRRGLFGAAGVVALVVAGFVALYFFSDKARERIIPMLRGEFESSRPLMWRASVAMAADHPWFGTGAGSYNFVYEGYRSPKDQYQPDWTHNDYLNTWSDYGSIGFVLWFGAGAALTIFGWRVLRAAQRGDGRPVDLLGSWRWRLALWLGWVAFVVHLAVDFHTKIPALAYASALWMALLLRERERVQPAPLWARAVAAAVVIAVVTWCVPRAERLYAAEAARETGHDALGKVAKSRATLLEVLPAALAQLERATSIDPGNAQAWSDLAYAISLSPPVTGGRPEAAGRRAEAAARRALAVAPSGSEYWVRLGTALSLQRRHGEADASFRRAIALAPQRADWRLFYASALASQPDRKADALRELEICLTLDPPNRQAKSLRARLGAAR